MSVEIFEDPTKDQLQKCYSWRPGLRKFLPLSNIVIVNFLNYDYILYYLGLCRNSNKTWTHDCESLFPADCLQAD